MHWIYPCEIWVSHGYDDYDDVILGLDFAWIGWQGLL
jgi:hypothetical protein